MKSRYITLILLTVGMAVSCTETTNVDPDTYLAPLFLQSSDSKIVFDKEGGKAVVTVSTNAANWDYSTQSENWFTINVDEDSCLVVNAPANYSSTVKTGNIKVTATRGEDIKEISLELAQRADDAIDLSANGTANCYIAHTNESYKFRADIKGNGGKDGKTEYIKTTGIEIKNVVLAELIWEARTDGDRTMAYEIIDGTPAFQGDYVSFSTGRSEGNALIAVKDSKGKILWSWHIWVTDNEITTHDHIGPEGKVIAQIMDRNLGALNNIPMDINNRGMFYQMGRKDPFIPSRSPYLDYSGITDYTNSTIYCGNDPKNNLQNLEIGDGTGSWEIGKAYKAQPAYTAPGNIPYSVEHPMRFLVPYYSSTSSWYSYASSEEAVRPGLWGEEKTIFDPCPPGYKVPGKDMWGTAVGTESIETGGNHDEHKDSELSKKYLWEEETGCGRVWKSTGDFYPMVGNIYPATENGTPYNYTSGQTFYLTSQESPYKDNSVYVAAFNGYWARYQTRAQIYTGQVRCVKE